MLLQNNIVKKYLNMLGEEPTVKPWQQYQQYFLNADIQANIHKIKEEQFQEGFLRELFVNVLGYTINPSPNYNLTTEKKNEVGSKKADGAILLNNTVIGVIELKDHKTPDLTSIEGQAFGYKSKHKDTRLVIISNFEKLRLYIENAVEYREWDIFHMTPEDFRELYLCLAWTQVERGVALQMKQESVSNEDQITKALYRDYSQFKRVLFADIVALNPYQEGHQWAADEKQWQLLLFKKTQKLLDRLLFIFFAEDCGLLPPNLIMKIIDQWVKLKEEFDEPRPFYYLLKKHFNYLNTGHKDIFAYNGGLFKPDEVLDSIKISDELLVEHTRRLAAYDFESDVDVNILGHIFENSLSEIEEVTQQITSGVTPQTSKRKQDGVFYTPQYITKYIVENTVGRLCAEKKQQLGIVDDEYLADQRRQLQTKQRLLEKLHQYREWLLEITILDPACGSGAFLNAALQFLMAEHKHLDEMEAKVAGSAIVFQDVENSILENNLYGVDINEESVGIAQLALWLRTAKPHRKLNSLNQNIKCGNSLISDPAIAGEKAFNWQEQFPKVFEKGFDVVIGNPPYVRADSPGNSLDFRNYMSSCGKWETLAGKWDLYIPFLELSIKLSTPNSLCSFIIPDAYCHAEYGKRSLEYMKEHHFLSMIDYFPNIEVFENVGVKSVIVNFDKRGVSCFCQRIHDENHQYVENTIDCYPDNLRIDAKQRLLEGKKDLIPLGNVCYITKGIVGNSDEKHYKGEFLVGDLLSDIKDEEHPKLYYEGKDISSWRLLRGRYIEYGTDRSPSKWSRKGFTEMFEGSPKLVTMRSPGSFPRTFLDTENGYFNESAIGFKRWIDLKGIDNNSVSKAYKDKEERAKFEEESANYSYKTLLAIFNSSLVRYELNTERRSNIHIYPDDWKRLVLPNVKEDQLKSLESLADLMLSLNSQLQDKRSRFLRRLSDNFEGLKITTALQQFDQMDFKGLMAELKKQKLSIPLKQQDEWEDYFTERAAECQELSAQIRATDEEIDNRVFDLYGLTEEERRIVMNP